MKAIIFGSGGQDGRYLSGLLEGKQVEIVGVDRGSGTDLSNFNEVRNLVRQHRPDFIFHFAANSATGHETWEENHRTITTGGLHILEAVFQEATRTKVFIPGSGLQFVNEEKPIRETDPFEASSVYAMSRIQSVYTARYYRNLGIPVYVGYFFTHDSPLRTARHINKKIIEAASNIAASKEKHLKIGDPAVEKEFGFAGDIVEAAWTLVNQDKVFEATIGTGKAHAIHEWLDLVFTHYGLNWKDHVVTDPGFKPDYRRLVSDPSTIFSLGWKPKTTIKELAQMMCKG